VIRKLIVAKKKQTGAKQLEVQHAANATSPVLGTTQDGDTATVKEMHIVRVFDTNSTAFVTYYDSSSGGAAKSAYLTLPELSKKVTQDKYVLLDPEHKLEEIVGEEKMASLYSSPKKGLEPEEAARLKPSAEGSNAERPESTSGAATTASANAIYA
jgi:hypothetical protein